MSAPIVVIGATGHIGRRLLERLVEDEREVVGVAHRLDDVDRVPGAEYVEADLTKHDDAMRVIRGARAIFLTLPENGANPLALEREVATNVIQAAREHSVPHLVMATALHADRTATGVPLLDNKRAIEQELQESGVPYTILRPGLFIDTMLTTDPHERRDTLRLPMAAGHPIGAVAARDVADAAARLLDGEPTNTAFDLHVPGGVRGEDLRRVESQLMERDIGYEEMKGDTADFAARLDMPPEERALYVDYLAYIRDHSYLGNADELPRRLPGFRYSSLEASLHDRQPRTRDFTVSGDDRPPL